MWLQRQNSSDNERHAGYSGILSLLIKKKKKKWWRADLIISVA